MLALVNMVGSEVSKSRREAIRISICSSEIERGKESSALLLKMMTKKHPKRTSWAELGHTRYQLMVCPIFQLSNLGGRVAGWLVGWLAGTLYSNYEASLRGSPLSRVWQYKILSSEIQKNAEGKKITYSLCCLLFANGLFHICACCLS